MKQALLAVSLAVAGCSGGSTSSPSSLPGADAGRDASQAGQDASRPRPDASAHASSSAASSTTGASTATSSPSTATASSPSTATTSASSISVTVTGSSAAASASDAGHDGGHTPRDAGHDATVAHDAAADAVHPRDSSHDVGHDAGHDSAPPVAILTGAIQKGPFILGSSVQLSAINASASPTGQVFSTTTTDDLGDFGVTFTYSGDVDMSAQGFYYDEVTGSLSAAPITLSALYDVASAGPQDAFINIVTHLAHGRAVSLMQGGATLAAAEAQAESELVAALGVGGSGFTLGGAGVSLNELGANSQSNAYLFAVSATMVEAVIEQSGTASLDANLQELLDTVSSHLAQTGTLPSSVTGPVLAAEQALDVDLTTDLFALRLAAVGSNASAANLDLAVDSDGDGYANSVDTCPLVANPDQSVIPTGVLCAVDRHTSFLPAGTSTVLTLPIVADIEGTGHAAVLYGDSAGWWLALGDGTGRFGAPTAVTLPASFTPVVAADVDQDGKLDLLGESGWVAGNGAGGFGALTSFASPFTTGLAVVDLNGDRVPDVAGMSESGLTVLLATAPGVFGAPVSSASPLADGTVWLTAVDVNDDGSPDIVAAGTSGDGVVFFGAGNGSFSAGPVTMLGSGAAGAAVADFDGDGYVDLAEWAGASVTIGFGDGHGDFESPATTAILSGAVAAGDFNADGKTDLWLAYDSACDASGSVMLSAGRTFFAPQSLHATPATCAGGYAVVAHDLTGDGTPDVLVVSEGGNGLGWNLQGYIALGCPGCACAGATCGGVCVDTQTDWFHCGGCGGACALGATCVSGRCECHGMTADCNGECIDETANILNCGSCGHACTATGESCVGGSCVCPGTQKVCDGACVDKSSDVDHCGGCGTVCATTVGAGAVCNGGVCACPGAERVCGGACVDTASDSQNCDGCGKVCPAGGSCADSTCRCPAGQVVCSDACVDLTSNVDNCGGCGEACSAPSPSSVSCTPYGCLVATPGPAGTDAAFLAANASTVFIGQATVATAPLFSVPRGGGPVVQVTTSPYSFVASIAADDTRLFWSAGGHSIYGLSLAGGPPFTVSPYGPSVDSMVLKGNQLFGSGVAFAVDGGAITYLNCGGQGIVSLALASNSLVQLDYFGAIWDCPFDGGVGRLVRPADWAGYSSAVSVADATVYWAKDYCSGEGLIGRIGLDGGPEQLTPPNLETPRGLVSDGTHVFVVTQAGIAVIPVAGGPVVTLPGYDTTHSILLQGSSVIWFDWASVVYELELRQESSGSSGSSESSSASGSSESSGSSTVLEETWSRESASSASSQSEPCNPGF